MKALSIFRENESKIDSICCNPKLGENLASSFIVLRLFLSFCLLLDDLDRLISVLTCIDHSCLLKSPCHFVVKVV